MKKIILALALMLFTTHVCAAEVCNISAGEALLKLKKGNEHFIKMHMAHPDETKHRRAELVKGQHPFAIILSCSDSRVPSEILFDQGLGDLFVIRNAGNVLDEHVIGSIEYAVGHLGVNLVVVLGHESCGAIEATMANAKGSKYIESLEKAIRPAIAQAKKENNLSPENVTKINAELDVKNILEESDELQEAVEKRGLKIIPAYYHLDSGKVEFLDK